MTASRLSALVGQPWDANRFDHQFALAWIPIIIGLMTPVLLLNTVVVATAILNSKLRVEIVFFAWNGIFFCICAGNALYTCITVGILAYTWQQQQWEQVCCISLSMVLPEKKNTEKLNFGQSFCARVAATNVFFLTLDMCLSICLTVERMSMVIFLTRVPPSYVAWSAVAAIGAAAGNTLISWFSSNPIIFASGLSCGGPYTLYISILDIVILISSLIFLIVGSTLCVWRLGRNKSSSARVMTAISFDALAVPEPKNSRKVPRMSLGNAQSKETRSQQRFALRGILSALSTSMTVIPMTCMLIIWAFYDRAAPVELELASLLAFVVGKFSDPVIVLIFDSKLREAMSSAFRRRPDPEPIGRGNRSSTILATQEYTG
ncbi:hypothetical protein BC828DRAFT_391041 [Blastocladiella britannica]|nr:hypothetical protein BC828DRAFT_391041 [Blastocladiella britannica]